MHLTRIRISVEEALGARLTDAYAWHQRIWTAFPQRRSMARDFLTRTDQNGRSMETLILSSDLPVVQPWGEWQSREVAPGFLEHTEYLFSLRANPTIKRVVRDDAGIRRKNGRRTRICDSPGLKAWLARKGDASGFAIHDSQLRIGPPMDQISWRKGHAIRHSRVDFQGVLQVRDRALFHTAYAHGIGPAKAFGFGLLLLKPLG